MWKMEIMTTDTDRSPNDTTPEDMSLLATEQQTENNVENHPAKLGSAETQDLDEKIQAEELMSLQAGPVQSDIDGGWGWMVVLGCAVMHCFLGGWSRCYGIIYVKLREKFQSSAAITAWVGGMGIAIRMGASPIANALAKRFSVRSVATIGGIIISVGIMLASFGPSVEYMFFPISFLAGIGGCLIYSPAIVHVGEYFDKRRGLATGMSTAGSGLGVFLFPPLMDALFVRYGFQGALLIFSALMLNCCVSGMLYRPLRKPKVLDIKLVLTSKNYHDIPNSASGNTSKGDVPTGLRKYLDYRLMLDIRFLCFAVSLALVTTAYMSAQIIVPDHAITCGIDEFKAALLLSMIGIADIFGRLGSGLLFDTKWIRPIRRHVYQWCIALTSVTIYGWGFTSSFEGLLVFCVLHGLFNGSVVSQRAVIVAEIMGIEKLSSSFGLTVFCQGFGALLGPMIAGLLRDKTGNYVTSFIFTGTCSTAAFVLLYVGCFYDYYLRKKQSPESNLKC